MTSVLDDDTITVGSFNFPECDVLAEIYALGLEGRGFRVERELDVGPRELLIPALQRGLAARDESEGSCRFSPTAISPPPGSVLATDVVVCVETVDRQSVMPGSAAMLAHQYVNRLKIVAAMRAPSSSGVRLLIDALAASLT